MKRRMLGALPAQLLITLLSGTLPSWILKLEGWSGLGLDYNIKVTDLTGCVIVTGLIKCVIKCDSELKGQLRLRLNYNVKVTGLIRYIIKYDNKLEKQLKLRPNYSEGVISLIKYIIKRNSELDS